MERINLNDLFSAAAKAGKLSNADTPEREAKAKARAELEQRKRNEWAAAHPGQPFPDDVEPPQDDEDDEQDEQEDEEDDDEST